MLVLVSANRIKAGYLARLLLVLGMGWWLLATCSSVEPIKIGYAGEMTGLRSELGVDGRNGAELAVAHINEQGGIDGRLLELIAKDDEGKPDVARQVDAELIEEEVVAIIGHITSQQTAAVIDQMNEFHTVLVSPTASSAQFSNREDYLFRVTPTTSDQGAAFAQHIIHNRDIHQITGVYDLSNEAFSEDLWRLIQTEFEAHGRDAEQQFTFHSGETDLSALMAEIAATDPEALMVVASDIDTALIAQYLRQQGSQAALFSSTWAYTSELIAKGGQAIEGIEIISVYNPYHENARRFIEEFEAQYGHQPSLAAAFAYESVLVLAEALRTTHGRAEGLPQALIQIQALPGLQGPLSITSSGDVNRNVYIITIQDGEFNVTTTIPPGP